MKYVVGAYAASPCLQNWDPFLETEFWDELAQLPELKGLELPFYGDSHRFDNKWLYKNLRPEWDCVLTCLPGTMIELEKNSNFGLASEDRAGRMAALAFAEKARAVALRLNDYFQWPLITAVEFHTAPRQGEQGCASSREAFTDTFGAIRSWDWEDTRLLVEHCDRYIPGQAPAKGFISLDDEIQTLQDTRLCRTKAGMLVNWARSAIEGRDPKLPLQHLRRANDAHVLKGLIFSGCTVGDPFYGDWADSHAPFDGVAGSQMTVSRARDCFLEAQRQNELWCLGFKIQASSAAKTIRQRVDLLKDTIEVLNCITAA